MEVPEASSVASQTIKPINKGVVHRICSGQVILDLSSAVKELVENSLDAGATSIEIAVREYGEESFQVIDNGSGISPQNFKLLALKHHTSKLSGFPDLQSLVTFGFRGEALSSLCALGDLTVETRTKNEPVATHLTFDHSGLVTAERKTARQIGTTVTVKKLFSSLPVRSKEFRRNIRKEYGKLITLLNAYALIAKGVRLVCTNTIKSSRSVVLKTQGTYSLKDNIITVFGVSTYNCLEPASMCILDDCKIDGFLSKPGYGSGRNLGDRQFFFVNGRPVDMPKVSKLVNELYRGANSKQYPIVILNLQLPTTSCDVNVTPDKRKVFFSDEGSLLKSLRGVIENIYSPDRACYQVNKLMELENEDHDNNIKLSSVVATNSEKNACCGEQNSECMVSLSFEDSPASLDIHDNDNSVKGKDFLLRSHRWKKEGHVSRSPTSRTENMSVHSSRLLGYGVSDRTRPPAHSSTIQSSLTKFVTVSKRKHESISTTLTEMPLLRNGSDLPESGDEEIAIGRALISSPCDYIKVDDTAEATPKQPGLSKFSRYSETMLNRNYIPSSSCNLQNRESRKEFEEETLNVADSVMDSPKYVQNMPKGMSDAVSIIQSPELSLKSPGDSSCQKVGSTLQFSLLDLKTRRQQRLSRLQMMNHPSRRMKNRRYFAAATIELPQLATDEGKSTALAAATSELERLFRKEDFRQMKVIGQFNLGFIVGKVGEDLFIVDQHAADEKYNYERLSQSTVLNQQPLLQSLRLELSPEEEIVVSMHMDIVRRNGFSLEEDLHAPPGRRFKLKAVPFSKNITFGVEDLKELISIVADGHGECSMIGSYRMDTADSVCPPRVRAMLASRACRTSVMVGDPLGRNEMQKILEHLADLRSPWNCPHGRPTMRHLVDLRTTRRSMEEDERAIMKVYDNNEK